MKSRRTFLKTAAAGSVGLAIPTTVASAAPTDEEKRNEEQQQFEKIAKDRDEKTIEEFHQELREAGFDVYTTKKKYNLKNDGKEVEEQDSDSNEISPQKIPESDIEVDLSLYVNAYSD